MQRLLCLLWIGLLLAVPLGLLAQDGFEDADGDWVQDSEDNCPDAPNYDQIDADGNGLGDACDLLVVPHGVEEDPLRVYVAAEGEPRRVVLGTVTNNTSEPQLLEVHSTNPLLEAEEPGWIQPGETHELVGWARADEELPGGASGGRVLYSNALEGLARFFEILFEVAEAHARTRPCLVDVTLERVDATEGQGVFEGGLEVVIETELDPPGTRGIKRRWPSSGHQVMHGGDTLLPRQWIDSYVIEKGASLTVNVTGTLHELDDGLSFGDDHASGTGTLTLRCNQDDSITMVGNIGGGHTITVHVNGQLVFYHEEAPGRVSWVYSATTAIDALDEEFPTSDLQEPPGRPGEVTYPTSTDICDDRVVNGRNKTGRFEIRWTRPTLGGEPTYYNVVRELVNGLGQQIGSTPYPRHMVSDSPSSTYFRRFVQVMNRSGHYVFRVQACNSHGCGSWRRAQSAVLHLSEWEAECPMERQPPF